MTNCVEIHVAQTRSILAWKLGGRVEQHGRFPPSNASQENQIEDVTWCHRQPAAVELDQKGPPGTQHPLIPFKQVIVIADPSSGWPFPGANELQSNSIVVLTYSILMSLCIIILKMMTACTIISYLKQSLYVLFYWKAAWFFDSSYVLLYLQCCYTSPPWLGGRLGQHGRGAALPGGGFPRGLCIAD